MLSFHDRLYEYLKFSFSLCFLSSVTLKNTQKIHSDFFQALRKYTKENDHTTERVTVLRRKVLG